MVLANGQKKKTSITPMRQLEAWIHSKVLGDFAFELAIAALPSLPTILDRYGSQRGFARDNTISMTYPFMITKNQ